MFFLLCLLFALSQSFSSFFSEIPVESVDFSKFYYTESIKLSAYFQSNLATCNDLRCTSTTNSSWIPQSASIVNSEQSLIMIGDKKPYAYFYSFINTKTYLFFQCQDISCSSTSAIKESSNNGISKSTTLKQLGEEGFQSLFLFQSFTPSMNFLTCEGANCVTQFLEVVLSCPDCTGCAFSHLPSGFPLLVTLKNDEISYIECTSITCGNSAAPVVLPGLKPGSTPLSEMWRLPDGSNNLLFTNSENRLQLVTIDTDFTISASDLLPGVGYDAKTLGCSFERINGTLYYSSFTLGTAPSIVYTFSCSEIDCLSTLKRNSPVVLEREISNVQHIPSPDGILRLIYIAKISKIAYLWSPDSVCDSAGYGLNELNICQQCPVGTFSSSASNKCQNCPRGSIANVTGIDQCVQCWSGTYQIGNSCEDCPANTYSEAGAVICNSRNSPDTQPEPSKVTVKYVKENSFISIILGTIALLFLFLLVFVTYRLKTTTVSISEKITEEKDDEFSDIT